MTTTSYLALRVRPCSSAPAWWTEAGQRRDAPAAVAALLGGRRRVEISPAEAEIALDWAGGLSGWATADPKPLFLHQPAASR